MIINRDCSVEGAHWRVFLDSASHWTPHSDAGSICRYSLDTASHQVTPHHDAGSIGGYFWIPHQVRNDREGIPGYRVVARYDVVAGSSV